MAENIHQRQYVAYQPATSEPIHKNDNTAITEDEVNNDSSTSSLKKKEQWRPGYLHQFPWAGFGALIGVVLCTSICVMLVYISNGKAKSEWKSLAAPNVLVSVFTAVSSILITMAVGKGIAISWWRKAIKGSTVEELHQSWSFGASFLSVFTGFKYFNAMALAALCTKLAIIDGVLFQKALTTVVALGPPRNSTVEIYQFPTFPITGKLNQYGNDTAEQTNAMTWDLTYWLNSNVYAGIDWQAYFTGDQLSGCDGLCALKYQGLGFASSCSMPTNQSNVSRDRSAVAAGNSLLLDINFALQKPTTQRNYSYIQMDWRSWEPYTSDTVSKVACPGQLYHLQCVLRPAWVEYPMVIQNSSLAGRAAKGTKTAQYTIKLGELNEKDGNFSGWYRQSNYTDVQLGGYTVWKYINVPEDYTPGGDTSLGGIVKALNTYYQSQSIATYQRINSTKSQNSTTYLPFASSNGLQVPFAQVTNDNTSCPIGFTSPVDEGWNNPLDYDQMLANINQLMLLVGTDPYLRDYPGQYGDYYTNYTNFLDFIAPYSANTTMVGLKPEIYYYSKVAFAWGAFASTIAIILFVLPTYWGYWELGRQVTLGPLEIANAFDAPAFSHVDRGSGHVDHVLDAVGKQKVKYNVDGKYGFVHH